MLYCIKNLAVHKNIPKSRLMVPCFIVEMSLKVGTKVFLGGWGNGCTCCPPFPLNDALYADVLADVCVCVCLANLERCFICYCFPTDIHSRSCSIQSERGTWEL